MFCKLMSLVLSALMALQSCPINAYAAEQSTDDYSVGIRETSSESVTSAEAASIAGGGLTDIYWSPEEKEKTIVLAMSWNSFSPPLEIETTTFLKYLPLVTSDLRYRVLEKTDGWSYELGLTKLKLYGSDNGNHCAYAVVKLYRGGEEGAAITDFFSKAGMAFSSFLGLQSNAENKDEKEESSQTTPEVEEPLENNSSSQEQKEENENPVNQDPENNNVNNNNDVDNNNGIDNKPAGEDVQNEDPVTENNEEPKVEETPNIAPTPQNEPVQKAANAPTRGGEAQTYNIIINYVFGDQTIAAEPFVTTVDAGDDFEEVVPSPVINGYEAYVGTDETPSTSVHLHFTNIQENKQVTVTYMPALVQYKVRHYLQNADNDDYTFDSEDTLYGMTGDIVDNIEKDTYQGFYSLLYEHPAIAADGSTIVDVYYDRYNFLMYFDLDGGTGVDPIYGRMGSTVSVGTPTKPGYSFTGWSQPVPSTIPYGNTSYTAQWAPAGTTYAILYWYENTTGVDSYSLQDSRIASGTTGSTVNSASFANDNFNGKEPDYFTHNSSKDETKVIEGDGTTTVNVYFSRNIVTYNFNYSNGNVLTLQGRYGSTFESNGVAWPSDATWQYTRTNGNTVTMTFMSAFIPTLGMPTSVVDFRERSALSGHKLYFYRQKADGSYNTNSLDLADNVIVSNGNFTLSEKYEGFHLRDYRRNDGSTRTYYTVGSMDGEEFTGDNVYVMTTATSANYTYYGVVNGMVVELTNGTWLYQDTGEQYFGEYKYAVSNASTSSNDSFFGIIDGELVSPVRAGTALIDENGNLFSGQRYNIATGNTGNQYGVVNGAVVRLSRSGNWFSGYTYRDPDGNVYYGTRYTTSNSGDYGFVNGEMLSVSSERTWLYDGVPYTGTRYTQTSTSNFPTSGTYYGYDNGQMRQLVADMSTFRYNGQPYTGDRYMIATNPGSTGTYYGMVNGVMTRIYYHNDSSGWGNWTPATADSTQIPSNSYEYQIRFERTKYDIAFYNYNQFISDAGLTMYYEAPLDNIGFTPSYPDDLPWGAYSFAGWYDNQELEGTPISFNGMKMPANNLTFFAKWEPIVFHVEVYHDLVNAENGTNKVHDYEVDYGGLCPVPEDPSRENMQFVGWFYTNDAGKELPFSFSGTTITKNMKVYAKWTSDVLKRYEFKFETEDGVTIADPIVSSGLMGSTKTVKASENLYQGYETGWFPKVKSHSILLDENEELNTFTFEYVYRLNVPYTVQYLDARTSQPIAPDKLVSENTNMLATEKFLPIEGYVPDAFRKSIVISVADDTSNVIKFYYTKSDTSAYYSTTHYVLVNGQWKVYNEMDILGTIGDHVDAVPMTIQGYYYNPNVQGTVSSGTVSLEGLEMKLYYEPDSYPYYVRYLEDKTNRVLHEEGTGSGMYQQSVSANAIQIAGYDLVSPTTQSIIIQIDPDGQSRKNIITFYYKLEEAVFSYIVAPTSSAGSVSVASEHVAARTGIAFGSVPSTNPGWEFDGWFLDREGTIPVTPDIATISSENNRIVPVKNQDDVYVTRAFYAVYHQTVGTVNVSMQLTGDGADMTDTFDYTITLVKNGVPYEGDIVVEIDGTETTETITDGTYQFSLGHEDEVILTLPATYSYTIQQTNNTGKPYTTVLNGASGTVVYEGTTATFVNSLKAVAQNDVRTRTTPFVWMFVFGGLAFIPITSINKRRKEEES